MSDEQLAFELLRFPLENVKLCGKEEDLNCNEFAKVYGDLNKEKKKNEAKKKTAQNK